MDRDTIIRLAEEAGLEPRLWNHTDAFERFAALVAAHEREECAKVCEMVPLLLFPAGPNDCADLIRSRT